MLSLPVSVRIFVCAEATAMRRSFDRLAQMVEEQLARTGIGPPVPVLQSPARLCEGATVGGTFVSQEISMPAVLHADTPATAILLIHMTPSAPE
jgi:hypothetical protein